VLEALKARVITALFLLLAFLSALFWLPAALWAGFAALIVALGGWEWAGLMRQKTTARAAYAVASAVLCLALTNLIFDWPAQHQLSQEGAALLFALYGLALILWLAIVPVWMAQHWQVNNPLLLALVGWLVLLPAGLALIQLREKGPLLLLAAMAVVWIADIAAYFTGRAFGQRKLAPAISPGKTWEGAYGALAAVLAYGLILAAGSGKVSISALSLLGLGLALTLLTAISIIGDLFESLMKRQAGVKDSGKLLPGHGGILDRIDSLTSTLPLVGLVALIFQIWE